MANFSVNWYEDASAKILGRITAADGSGAATGVNGEGNWLQQADVSAIVCTVFDLDISSTAADSTPAIVIATSVLDVPLTSNVLWTRDTVGYNFEHDLDSTVFPVGGHQYQVEYKITLTGGAVFHGIFVGIAAPILGS